MAISNLVRETIGQRIARLDWNMISEELSCTGFAMTPPILSEPDCADLASMFWDDRKFRKTIDMAKKSYGRGMYKYFAHPLPETITEMRTEIYRHLAPIANNFNAELNIPARYSDTHQELLAHCIEAGQTKPTPLLLHYEQGDFNAMHQDVYGELTFPLQVTLFLSQVGTDYEGGEFLIQEQTFRTQPRVHVLKPMQGQMIIFTTRHRPERTARGFRRVNVKHGVATITSGKRDTCGIIFHDAT